MTRSARVLLAVLLLVCPAAGDVPGPVGSEFEASETTGTNSSIAVDGLGRTTVVWAKGAQVFVRRFDPTGVPLGPELPISGGPDFRPAVAAAASGAFLVVWEDDDGSGSGILGRLHDADGAPLGPDFQVNASTTGDQSAPRVATDAAGGYVVVWSTRFNSSNATVFARRYDADGMPLGVDIQVSTPPGSRSDILPSVGVESGGRFLVVWTRAIGSTYRDLFARLFDAGGTALGAEFHIDAQQAFPGWSDVGADPAGNFTVVWEGSTGIRGQRYDVNGAALGVEFAVSSAFGRKPRITSAPSGQPIVVWEGNDADPIGVIGRRFDADFGALGPEFQINTYTAGGQGSPAVAMASGGDFVAVWQSPQALGGTGIFGQRYAADGTPEPGYVPISGARLTVKDPSNPARRAVMFKSRDERAGNGINDIVNPVVDGAVLHVYNSSGTGDAACFPLPASGWSSRGTPVDPLYVYRDLDYVHGPCRVARIRRNRFVRALCRARTQPITYTLDEPAQGSVSVALTVGPATYCADFGGGAILLDSGTLGRFKARLAPVPAACPTPPSACP